MVSDPSFDTMYIVDAMFLLAFVCMNRHSLIKLAITCNNFRDYLIVASYVIPCGDAPQGAQGEGGH